MIKLLQNFKNVFLSHYGESIYIHNILINLISINYVKNSNFTPLEI